MAVPFRIQHRLRMQCQMGRAFLHSSGWTIHCGRSVEQVRRLGDAKGTTSDTRQGLS